MAEIEEKLKWLQALVVSQWKSGKAAELRLFSENGHLSVRVSADFGPASWNVDTVGAYPGTSGGRASTSRVRRRQRRAAVRAAEDAKKADAEISSAEKETAVRAVAEKAASERAAAEEAALKVAAEEAAVKADAEEAAEKVACAEKAAAAAEKATARKEVSDELADLKQAEMTVAAVMNSEAVPSTSCNGRQVTAQESCWNCGGEMSVAHQCDISNTTVDTAPHVSAEPPLSRGAVSSSLLKAKMPGPSAPIILKKPVKMFDRSPIWTLPLCHYCCHRGSGDNPVHYVLQCLCEDKVCSSCQCYCSKEQLVHKKKFFPGGFSGSLVPVSPGDRPRARAMAEARANKLDYWGVPMASRPCDNDNCL